MVDSKEYQKFYLGVEGLTHFTLSRTEIVICITIDMILKYWLKSYSVNQYRIMGQDSELFLLDRILFLTY